MRGIGRAILSGGLIAGTIDIGAASLIFRATPFVIAQNIAGGLVGEAAAHDGGLQTALLGLALQLGMSCVIAAIYCLAASNFNRLLTNPLSSGLAYGVIIFFVMNYVVVPFSAIARVPHFSLSLFVLNLAAMLLFGVIISFSAQGAIRITHGEATRSADDTVSNRQTTGARGWR